MTKEEKEIIDQELVSILKKYRAFLVKHSSYLAKYYTGEVNDLLSQCTTVFIEAYYTCLSRHDYDKRHLLSYCLKSVINFRKCYIHARMNKKPIRYNSYVVENNFVSFEDLEVASEQGIKNIELISSNTRPDEEAEINEIIDYVFVNLETEKEKQIFNLLLGKSSIVVLGNVQEVKLDQKKIAELYKLSRSTVCRVFAKIKELILSY